MVVNMSEHNCPAENDNYVLNRLLELKTDERPDTVNQFVSAYVSELAALMLSRKVPCLFVLHGHM